MPKTTSFRHTKLHVKSQIVMHINSRPSPHVNLGNLFISLHNLIITYIAAPIHIYSILLYLCLVLVGLRGGCGVGALGVCGSAVVLSLWRLGALELPYFGTLLSLELKGSCEDILYDEIYIMIIEK